MFEKIIGKLVYGIAYCVGYVEGVIKGVIYIFKNRKDIINASSKIVNTLLKEDEL